MTLTALQIISSSLRLLGVLAAGETPTANEQNDALLSLNDLIDSWSTEQMLIPAKIREVFPLVSGQQTYQMGTGAPDFNTVRAQKIENCIIQLPQSTNIPLEIPMAILTKEEYQAIILKTLQSTFPLYMYNDQAYPLDNLNFWPVPNTSVNNVVLYSWKPLSEFSTITTQAVLPPGYQRALRYNLAVEIAQEFGRKLDPSVMEIAIQSKATIKRMNHRPRFLQVDKELRAKPAVWNWLTGEPI